MLFLGAGASKPFGVPTMTEFTDEVIKELDSTKRPAFGSLVRGLRSSIGKAGLNRDIESMLTVLQAKANPRKALEDIGAQAVLFADEFPRLAEDKLAKATKEQIEKIIYSRCSKVNHRKAIELYDQLWKGLTTNVRFKNVGYGSPNYTLAGRVFTTNYDLAIESFLKNSRIRYSDGFEIDEVGDPVFTGGWVNADIGFYKLHGSINYFDREDGQIVRSDAILENADVYGRQVKGRIMIYPTGEKYATRRPFYECLGQLRSALANQEERACIVIGYSFRDAAINNAFLDGITLNPKLKVVWITPHSESNFATLAPQLQSRAIPLNGEFGNPSLPQSIMEVIHTNIDP
jgi:hypothetical protein